MGAHPLARILQRRTSRSRALNHLTRSFTQRADLCDALAEALHDHRHALATANTHGFQAVALVAVLQTIDERGHDARASHAEWMTECDCPTVHVELVHRDTDVLGRRNHLRSECLVDFEEVDLLGFECKNS